MANIRIYTGDAVGQNELSEDWFRRRLASEAEGCGFDPRLAHHFGFDGRAWTGEKKTNHEA